MFENVPENGSSYRIYIIHNISIIFLIKTYNYLHKDNSSIHLLNVVEFVLQVNEYKKIKCMYFKSLWNGNETPK